MTIKISEISSDFLKTQAVEYDRNSDGNLNKEEFDSLFNSVNKITKPKDNLSKIGKITSYGLMGLSGVGIVTSLLSKTPKKSLLYLLGGVLGFGTSKLYSKTEKQNNSVIKELEALRTKFEVPVEQKKEVKVPVEENKKVEVPADKK